jgi:hypothetical protein
LGVGWRGEDPRPRFDPTRLDEALVSEQDMHLSLAPERAPRNLDDRDAVTDRDRGAWKARLDVTCRKLDDDIELLADEERRRAVEH